MRKLNVRSLTVTFILLLLLTVALAKPLTPVQAKGLELLASLTSETTRESRIDPEIRAALASMTDEDMITVIVTMRSQADLSNIQANSRQERISQVIKALKNKANATQLHIRALLESKKGSGEVADYESFWVFNGLVVTAKASVIDELAARPEIATISPNEIDVIEAGSPASTTALLNPEPNLALVNAPALWDLGYQGQGIVVANLDSGVDYTHPDLNNQWRGGTNSWFDPYGEHQMPTDLTGHGTWTMGVMVGGDYAGTDIGLAPGAQWIAAKIFDDSGGAESAAIHAAFQWVLDPDNNPATPDTPYVINNSWTYASAGCNLEFELDLQALRAAGILPVFAAGNAGPSSGTSYSPANNPSAFAVGATTNSDAIYFESSRGPSACGELQTIFPELVAPGVNIYTSDIFGLYTSATGTSMAAPHVSGALALLLSASPNLTAFDQENALINGALDLGLAGPDNDYGFGRLDVYASYQGLGSGGNPTPTPVPMENLAFNRPVTVSSFQDDSHDGSKSVDANQDTFWKTKRVKGKNGPNSEYLMIDLGNLAAIYQITISWHDYYATAYDFDLSDNGSDWTTVSTTSSGDGGTDTIVLAGAAAQYVRMTSSAWNDNSLRNWVREIEVLGIAGSPVPTETPTPTDTPAPTNTPTPTGTPSPTPSGQATMHVGDLDGSSQKLGKKWRATVTITVHDGNEMPLANADVTGAWSGGFAGTDSCVTDGNGQCSLSTGNMGEQQASVTFSVDDLTRTGYSYAAADNHDTDGDSNGTIITVSKP